MSGDLISTLVHACWAASASGVAVALLRRLLRRWFGADVAYRAWWAVPISIVAALLPFPRAIATPTVLQLSGWPAAALGKLQPAPAMDLARWSTLELVWLLGAIAVAFLLVVQHRRFVRALGPLEVHEGVARACVARVADAGPLLLGLLRPVIVVPGDFEERYTARERTLILAHEEVHLARGDVIANLLSAVLQCLFWFNPLIHLCVGRFRFDQELACDDVVLRRYPDSRRSYAEAILKTQSRPPPFVSPFCCRWQLVHPLKERILNLQHVSLRHHHRLLGQSLVGLFIAAAAYGAWAAQGDAAPDAVRPSYRIALTIKADGKSVEPQLLAHAGEPISLTIGEGASKWSAQFVLATPSDNSVELNTTMKHGDEVLGTPALRLALGQTGSLTLADSQNAKLEMQVRVTPGANRN
jgi:bla regulator protein blaR1